LIVAVGAAGPVLLGDKVLLWNSQKQLGGLKPGTGLV
jgi:hypothetical protein